MGFFFPRLLKYTNIVTFAEAISKYINEACRLGSDGDLQLQGVKLESPSTDMPQGCSPCTTCKGRKLKGSNL